MPGRRNLGDHRRSTRASHSWRHPEIASRADLREVSIDRNGRFSIRGLTLGTYALAIRTAGFHTTTVNEIQVTEQGTVDLGRIPIAVASMCGQLQFVYSWTSAQGQGGLRGSLLIWKYGAEDAKPGRDARIDFYNADGKKTVSIETDREGRFLLRGIPPGLYTFRFLGEERTTFVAANLTGQIEWSTSQMCPDGGCDRQHPPNYAFCE